MDSKEKPFAEDILIDRKWSFDSFVSLKLAKTSLKKRSKNHHPEDQHKQFNFFIVDKCGHLCRQKRTANCKTLKIVANVQQIATIINCSVYNIVDFTVK